MSTHFYQPDDKQRLIQRIQSQHRALIETRQTHKHYKKFHETHLLQLISLSNKKQTFKKRFDALTSEKYLSCVQKLVELQRQKLLAQVDYESSLLKYKSKQSQNKYSRMK